MAVRPWETLSSELLLDCRYLRVHQQKVRTGHGVLIPDFHIIESPPWAAILAITEAHELVLVEQYRHGHGGASLELPAGIVEPEENILRGAARELEEETGYVSDEIALFWQTRPEPARHSHWAHFAIAKNVRRAKAQTLDEAEEIKVITRPLDQLDAIVEEMVHSVHVAALLLAERKGLLD